MSILKKIVLFPFKLFPQYPKWKSNTQKCLFRIKRKCIIGPAPKLEKDIKTLAAKRNWKYKEHTKFSTQRRVPSLGIVEDTLDIVRKGKKLSSTMYEALISFSASRGEMYYSHLQSVSHYPLYETFTCEIPNATLFCETGEVISEDYELLTQANQLQVTPFKNINEGSIKQLPTQKGTYLSLLDHFSQNYTHWIIDCLPKLALINRNNKNIKILVPKKMTRYQQDSLEILGIEKERLIPVNEDYIKVENLIISHPNQNCGVPHKKHITYIIEELKAPFKASIPEERKRIYISRSRSRRKITNENQLLPLLEKYNFEIIHAEDLSLREQIKLFCQTNVIAGPHGAGIVNHLFCEPGTKIIQIFNEKRWEHMVCRTASILKQEHWHMFAKNTHKNFDTWVDVKKFEKLLDYALNDEPGNYEKEY